MTEWSEEIVIVGGGMIGLASALAMRQLGFDVSVFDRKPAPTAPADVSANVIAMNNASTELLEDLGVFEQIPLASRPAYRSMQVYDGEGTGSVRFEAADAGYPQLGYIVDQRALVFALASVAAERGVGLNWETDHDLQASKPALLIAADGAHSATREALGFRKLNYSYDQHATVCTASLSASHDACAWQWFHEDGPVALLPLADPNTVAVVWSSSRQRSGLDDAAFLDELNDATEGRLGEVTAVGPRFSFPLMQLHTFSYVAPGVALIGDAAHAIHPLAGQGANLGFADVAALATTVGAARIEGVSPGDLTLLRRFEQARRTHNHLAGAAMEGFHQLFTNRSPMLSVLRGHGMRFVQNNPLLRKMAVSIASGKL